MDVGMIIFWVFFSVCGAIVAVGWLTLLLPAVIGILEGIWHCLRVPRCCYYIIPEEFKAGSEMTYNEYGYSESRYICICDRSVCLYQLWHLKYRIINKLRSQIGFTRSSSPKQSDDDFPMSQHSIPPDEPSSSSSSSSSVPKNPYITLTMDHGIDWEPSSSQTKNDTMAQQ